MSALSTLLSLCLALVLIGIIGCGNTSAPFTNDNTTSAAAIGSGGSTTGGSGTGNSGAGTGSGDSSGSGTGSTSGSGTGSGGSSGSGTGSTSGSGSGGGTGSSNGGAPNPSTCDGDSTDMDASSIRTKTPGSVFLYVGGDYPTSATSCKIAGFAVADNGSLQSTPGSPYLAPGLALAAHPVLPILYGSNTNELATYFIGRDGTPHKNAEYTNLTSGARSFVWKTLVTDPLGTALYGFEWAISGLDETLESRKMNSDGTLVHIQNIDQPPAPRSISFSPDGSSALITSCSHLGRFVDLYKRSLDGTLSLKTSGYPRGCPISASMSADGRYFAMVGIISQTYTPVDNVLEIIPALNGDTLPVNTDGRLVGLKGSPYSIGLIGISDVTWHPSGDYIAVAAENGVSIYRFSPDSTPILIAESPYGNGTIDRVIFNRAGTLLFAISSKTQSLYVFRFEDGVLTSAPGSPHTLAIVPYNFALVE